MHQDARPDCDEFIREIIIGIVQAGMVLARAEEDHCGRSLLAEASEVLRGPHRQIAAVMRQSLRGQRAPQVGHRRGMIVAMREDVVVRHAHAEPALDGRGPDAPFRIEAKPFHPAIGQRAQGGPDLGASGAMPKARVPSAACVMVTWVNPPS